MTGRAGVVCALLLGLFLPVGGFANSQLPESVRGVGYPAPDFTLPALAGHASAISLSAYRGQSVLLEFWSYWCGPCREGLPGLVSLRQQYAEDELAIIAVSVDPDGDGAEMLRTVAGDLVVADDRHGAIAKRFDVELLPAAFVIGADGVVRNVFLGGMASESVIRSSIEESIRAN